ncbi:ABC transporter substrate-binding protein, partial [Salmonella enterica subsp. enterica serovar Enteritidis]|nr:ABC transporter substrate-binding protein [Salmonella enterica subsp. enterica serovar Enteritidis]
MKASDVMGCMMGHKVRTNVNAQSSAISALLIASVSISGATLTACSPSSTPPSPTSQSASTTASSANGNHASNTDAMPNASIASAAAAVPNQLTIYTSIDKAALEPLLTSYARQINVPIHIVQDEPMSILARLKAEGTNSPADVILTEDAGIFSTAVEEGLLQPFNAEKAVAHVPERYRDPDGNWIALSSYARTAVYDSRVLHSNDISSYADLSKPKWSQKLCLSQGKYIPNQSLVVNLINNLGDKRTQEVMQGWLANLSVPVLLDDNEVLKAIESGKCQIGLVNSNHY